MANCGTSLEVCRSGRWQRIDVWYLLRVESREYEHCGSHHDLLYYRSRLDLDLARDVNLRNLGFSVRVAPVRPVRTGWGAFPCCRCGSVEVMVSACVDLCPPYTRRGTGYRSLDQLHDVVLVTNHARGLGGSGGRIRVFCHERIHA